MSRGPNSQGWAATRPLALVAAILAAVGVVVGVRAVHHSGSTAPDLGGGGLVPQPSVSAAAAASGHPSTPDLTGVDALRTGDCATWDQTAGADDHDIERVSCAQAHLVEITGTGMRITGLPDTWPGDATLDAHGAAQCSPDTTRYLGYSLDPAGRFSTSSIWPTEAGWDEGDRALWCTVQLNAPDGKKTPSFTGRVKGSDQTYLDPVGTCFRETATSLGDALPCAKPHTDEIAGYVRLPASQKTLPSDERMDQLAGSVCASVVRNYTKAALPVGARGTWLPLEESSWAAGRRLVECVLTTSDGTHAALITGSHRAKA